MQVILLRRVEKLGQMGDLVDVKPGFFRNFLFPRGFADRASESKIQWFKEQKAQLEAENLATQKEAETLAAKMSGLTLTFIRPAGETGHLYGSIRTKEIVEAVVEGGFTINRSQVFIEHPIKTLGIHTVYIVLHPDVRAPITLNIALSDDEALAQFNDKKNEFLEAQETEN